MLSGTFAALENPDFRVLWAGTFLAFIAFFMSTAVQGIVAFNLSGSNSAVGFVVFAQGLAQLVLGPFGGALADRISKRLVIMACQVVITAAFLGTAVLLALDLITLELLAAGSFLISASC